MAPETISHHVNASRALLIRALIDYQIMEQMSHFNCLENYTGYDKNYDINEISIPKRSVERSVVFLVTMYECDLCTTKKQ